MREQTQRGGILLLVMWLVTALSFVALALALSVRTELAATEYRLGAEQSRFLARGAIEQSFYLLQNPGVRDAEGNLILEPGRRYIDFAYSLGTVRVTVGSEAGMLDFNTASAERLALLLEAAGAGQSDAQEMAEAITDWRRGAATVSSPFDLFYASLAAPYRAAHRPLERLEELLLVKGVTPELYYGWMERDADGRLIRRGGLNRLLTVHGGAGAAVAVNAAPYEVLMTVPGMTEEAARAIEAGRRTEPYRGIGDLPIALPLASLPYLSLSESSDRVTLTATGIVAGTKASVRAIVRRDPSVGLRLLQWEEQAVAEEAFAAALQ